jgi:hypothetical protein
LGQGTTVFFVWATGGYSQSGTFHAPAAFAQLTQFNAFDSLLIKHLSLGCRPSLVRQHLYDNGLNGFASAILQGLADL